MKNAYTKVNTKVTPQNQAIPGKNQIKNNAGGYVFQADDWKRLNRFLILGSSGGTYYVSEQKLTLQNFDVLERLANSDGKKVVDTIVDVLTHDKAIKPDPALFALAYCTSVSNEDTRKAALNVVSDVCRIPTQLFHFIQYARQFRGWGRGLRKAIAQWYTKDNIEQLAYHMVKYQSRDGWSNADLIRLSHPKPTNAQNLFKWILGKEGYDLTELPIVQAFENAKVAVNEKDIVKLIMDYKLPREAIPTVWLNNKEVWDALLDTMPLTAMIRNLGKMTSIGLLDTFATSSATVINKLSSQTIIERSHVHPMTLLIALKTYAQGHGDKGSLNWNPVANISDALDDAFYLAMGNVKPTNKKLLVSVDESGSMSAPNSGLLLSCAESAAVMAMVHVHAEPAVEVTAYATKIRPISISKRERLDAVMRKFGNGGGTDSSLPMAYAIGKQEKYDAIVEYTDNETWAGGVHVCQHMQNYRRKVNMDSKLVIGAMVANHASLPDPNDTKALEVVGFDANAPEVIYQFLTDSF